MKIYFSNNKYLNIDNLMEKYYKGFKYLSFNVINSTISFDTIYTFLNNKENLKEIIVTTDENIVINNFNNIYKSLYSLNRMTSIDGNILLSIYLSSSEDGMEDSDIY